MKSVIEEYVPALYADVSELKDLAEILANGIDEEEQTLNCIWYT